MNAIGTIRTFTTANFKVIVDAVEECSPDLSWDEDGSVQEGINSGKFILFCARARVLMGGHELASDYLGNCIYESIESFEDHRECAKQNREYAAKGDAGRCGSYFADMVHNVIEQARGELAAIHNIKIRT